MKNSRRDFLKKGALAGFGALMIPEIAKAAVKENTSVHAPKINLKKDCVILFQGDSILIHGRKSLRVQYAADRFTAHHPISKAASLLVLKSGQTYGPFCGDSLFPYSPDRFQG